MSNDNNTNDYNERGGRVLELYDQGKSTREIAKELRMSLRDIGFILKNGQVNHGIVTIDVLQQLKNLEKWKSSVSYGQRWIVESVFSSIKRMFGEYVSARRFPNMVKEMMLKASLYNMFITMK